MGNINDAPLVRSGISAVTTQVNETAQRLSTKNFINNSGRFQTWQFLVYKEHNQINGIPAGES